jgi:hypothetical protein
MIKGVARWGGGLHSSWFDRKTVKNLLQSSIVVSVISCGLQSCSDDGSSPPATDMEISTDTQFFAHVTQSEPFTSYTLFPNVDSVTSGTLNGSTARQPLVKVSMNMSAIAALQNGNLPSDGSFPDGSVILKQIIANGQTVLYAIIYKDRGNVLAGNGWLWAEYQPDGTVVFSIDNRGSECVGCHMREQEPQNDFVRTFERQP